MPFTAPELARVTDYALQTISRKEPIDQITKTKPFLDYLLSTKVPSNFTGGVYRERIIVGNDSNYQNYFGRDQVTYNSRDPARLTSWGWSNFHDGFGYDEDEMLAAGIILTDDTEAVASGAEKEILGNKLKESYTALRNGAMVELDKELHRDGTQNAKATPGLDSAISTLPTTGTQGGIARSNTYWQNNVNLNVSTANLLAEMEKSWRLGTLYGGKTPGRIFAGSLALDAYRAAIKTAGSTQITYMAGKNGTALDGAVTDLTFHGVPIIWDPTLDQLDVDLGVVTYPYGKRMYFIPDNTLILRPAKGHWMLQRKPERLPDRYFHYWGLTSKYALTTNRPNATTVLSVA